MRNRQSHVVDTLRQVQVFLDTNAGIVGPTIASSRRSLDDVVTRLTAFAADQETSTRGSRGETARQRVLRAALRTNHMRPIAEVAKQKLRDVPEFRALTMPAANATSTQLVAAAAAMADAALAHEAVFTDVGMPDAFVASLRAAASAVSQSIDGRKQHAGKRSGATAGLAAEEKRGRSMIRLIDAIVVPRLGSNDALLAEWRSAKRVPRKTGPVGTFVAGPAAAASPAVSGASGSATTPAA
ncbi:MAG: hypothetical protein JWM41_895 [Gemmatimonadetes bacterium]|nr:hypothetical protein [Gemmatimonadota bacterium]